MLATGAVSDREHHWANDINGTRRQLTAMRQVGIDREVRMRTTVRGG